MSEEIVEATQAALEWAKAVGYAQRAREDAEGAQDKIEHLEKVVDEWRKACDAIDRCGEEVRQRELETRKELEQAQARVRELEQQAASAVDYFSMEKIKELERKLHMQQDANNMRKGDFEHKQRRIDGLEQHIDDLRKLFKDDVDKLVKQLDAAKDARIEAEREAADLRAWRKGLVKRGTEEPPLGTAVVTVNAWGTFAIDRRPLHGGASIRWFDPRDIFAAADRDAEKEGE